jgi:DNA-binding Lrp family transcriptional regulator
MSIYPLKEADGAAVSPHARQTPPEDAHAGQGFPDGPDVADCSTPDRSLDDADCCTPDFPLDAADCRTSDVSSDDADCRIPDFSLDDTDCRILDSIQTDFPLVSRPYAVIGERCGTGEEEAFRRVRALRERGLIRRLGAVFDSGRLGYVGVLCAAKVPPDRLATFTAAVNALAGVTHNYLRRHAYNIWFTCTAPSSEALDDMIDGLARRTEIAIARFPAERMYKIKVDFRMRKDTAPEQAALQNEE